MFPRQDPHALAVLAEAASDDLQQYLAGVRYQRDAPVVAALCLILLFVEYHDDVCIMYICMYVRMYAWPSHIYSKGKDQSGQMANPARGQLNREKEFFPVPVRA